MELVTAKTKPKSKLKLKTNVATKTKLAPKKKRTALQTVEQLQREGINVRESAEEYRSALKEWQDAKTKTEYAVKTINEANVILSTMFGKSNSVVSLQSLKGAKVDTSKSPLGVRNFIVEYFTRRGLRLKLVPNASDMKTVLNALRAAESNTEYNAKELTKSLALIRSEISSLERELNNVENEGMHKVMRNRVERVGLDPLSAMRSAHQAAKDVRKDVTDIEDKMSAFLSELSKIAILRKLKESGADVEAIKAKAKQAVSELQSLETSIQQEEKLQKTFESKLKRAHVLHERWVVRQTESLRKKYPNKAQFNKVFESMRLKFRDHLNILEGRLGLAGIVNRNDAIEGLHSKAIRLRSTLKNLLAQIEASGLDLGSKSFDQRERELRNYLQQGKMHKTIRNADPLNKTAKDMLKGDVWADAVKAALADPTKTRSFPSISGNATVILVDKRARLDIAPDNRDAESDIKDVILLGLGKAEAWFRDNFAELARRTTLASILGSMNVTMSSQRAIDLVVSDYFAKVKEYLNSNDAETQLQRTISAKISSGQMKTQGLSIDVNKLVYAKSRASALINLIRSPSFTTLNLLRGRTLLAFRQQLNDWTMRNVRVEGN